MTAPMPCAAALSLVLVSSILAGAASSAAELPGPQGAGGGRIRQGSFLLAGDGDGRLHLFMGNEPLLSDSGIACGHQGYTKSGGFADKKVERQVGLLRFRGSLPGAPVTFEQNVSIDDERIRIELARRGAWPADAGWCSFGVLLPIARYGQAEYRADGSAAGYPDRLTGDGNIQSGIRRLECHLGDPALNLIFECPTGMVLQDGRRWGGQFYQIGAGFPPGEEVRFDLFLTLPRMLEGLPEPRLCVSQIGYPLNGLKFVVLEWPKGTPRPEDWVRLEKDGRAFRADRFGPTVDYDFMQSSFAVFDFSDVREPGDYRILWSGGAREVPVRESVFGDRLWEPTLDFFIPWQMCHAALEFGGRLPIMKPCHMDDGIRVPPHFPELDGFRSYNCEGTPYSARDPIPCALGGWHDAGDDDLNVHAQGFTVWVLALAHEEFALERDVATLDVKAQRFELGRPDGVPDIVQQIEWGALWLLSMQQPDGRVYPGVIGQPGSYGASKLPELTTDGLPGTGDERHVYVDYHPDVQLAQAISLAAASRALAEHRPQLAVRCLQAAQQAFACFRATPETYRPTVYFRAEPEHGRDGMVLAAAVELYLTTSNNEYMELIAGMADAIRDLPVTWPSPYCTNQYGFWYAPPFLARLYPQLAQGELGAHVVETCRRALETQAQLASPRPWPYNTWHFGQWGNSGHCVGRVFNAYYLERVVPGTFTVSDSVRDMLWAFGLHPLSDTVFVCDVGHQGPRHLYNGRLHGLYGAEPSSVPGAVVPGMGSVPDAAMLVYHDRPGNYHHNEACIYTAASYIFAVNALKKAGY